MIISEAEKYFSLIPDVCFPSVEGVDFEDSMEGSRVSSLDVPEILIESGVDEVEHLMPHGEEVGSPFDVR